MFALCLSGMGVTSVLLERARLSVIRSGALLELLLGVRNAVENYSMPVSEILARCPCELLERCGYPIKNGIPQSFASLFSSCDISDVQSRSLVERFARDFGKDYRQRQSELCDVCIDGLRKRSAELEMQLPQKRKMIIGVCTACTAIVLLMLI